MPIIKLDYTNTKIHDTYVRSDTPSVNYSTSASLFTEAELRYSLLKFDLGLIPNNAIINAATLTVYSSGSQATTQLSAHEVMSDWDATTATWDNKPALNSVAVNSVPTPTANQGAASLSIKSLVQKWVNGENHGVGLKSAFFTFLSTEYGTATYRPTLTIDYEIPTTKKKQVEHIATNYLAPPNGTTTVVNPLPSGIQKGDMLMSFVQFTTATDIVADGWTLLSNEAYNSAIRLGVLFKTATENENNSEIVLSGGVANNLLVVNHVFRNVKDVKAVSGAITQIGSGTSVYPNAVTGLSENAMLLTVNTMATPATFTPSLGFKELSDNTGSSRSTQVQATYNHKKTSYTVAEMTVLMSTTNASGAKAIALEPITNEPPEIDGADEHLGTYDTPLSKEYIVSDTEGDLITIVERLDGAILRTLDGVGTYTLDLATQWAGLTHGKHAVTITVTDPEGRSEVRTWTFTKVLNMNDDTDTLIKGLLDTVPELMKGKALLGKAIRDNGGSVLDTDALEVMAKAVGGIDAGFDMANGVVSSSNNPLVIRGLSFRPKIIAVRRTDAGQGHIYVTAYVDAGLLGSSINLDVAITTSTIQGNTVIYDDGFSIATGYAGPHGWVALG